MNEYQSPLPDKPTTAAPGTAEKMEVMLQRRKQKRSLFHPFDASYPGDPAPEKWNSMGEFDRIKAIQMPKETRETAVKASRFSVIWTKK